MIKFTTRMSTKIILTSFLLMVLVVVIYIGTEYYNILFNSSAMMWQMKHILESSCNYFMQETYRGNKSNMGNAQPIYDIDGNVDKNLDGKFYLETEEATYYDLYPNSYEGDFQRYCQQMEDEMQSDEINIADSFNFKIMKGVADGTETSLVNQMITPANLGWVYIDRQTVKKIFKWQLVNFITGSGQFKVKGDKDEDKNTKKFDKNKIRNRILREDLNEENNYVRWNGFRIYYNTLVIEPTYLVFDMKDEDGDDVAKYAELTNIGVHPSSIATVDSEGKTIERTYNGNNEIVNFYGDSVSEYDIRRWKVVAIVNYNVEVQYEGIFPLRAVVKAFVKDRTQDRNSIKGFDDKILKGKSTIFGGDSGNPIVNDLSPRAMMSNTNDAEGILGLTTDSQLVRNLYTQIIVTVAE